MDSSVGSCLSFLLLYSAVSQVVVSQETSNNDGENCPVTTDAVAELRTELQNLRATIAEMTNERESIITCSTVVLQCYRRQAIAMEQAKIRPSLTLYSLVRSLPNLVWLIPLATPTQRPVLVKFG